MSSALHAAVRTLRATITEPTVLAGLHLDLDRLGEPSYRIPAFLSRHAWEQITALSGTADFGFIAAQQHDPTELSGLPYLMQVLPSGLQALEVLLQYWPAVAGHMRLGFDERYGIGILSLLPVNHLDIAASERDYWMTRLGLYLTNHVPAITEIRLRTSAQPTLERYRQRRRVPVCGGAEEDALCLDMRLLGKLRTSGSPAIIQALVQALDEHARQRDTLSLLVRVSDLVIAGLGDNISQETVAEQLHMTPRTLHRALLREGWNFTDILECHRRQITHDLLSRGEHSISELATHLGYSTTSSFSRAFQRWYGCGPSDCSKSHLKFHHSASMLHPAE